MKHTLKILVAITAGLFGGWIGKGIFHPSPATANEKTIFASEIRLLGPNGKTYAELTKGKGQASQFAFINQNGKRLLELGLDEKGLPYIRLSGDRSYPMPKAQFVLAGSQESALLILKDTKGKDRLVMGIDPNDENEEPFFAYFDKGHQQHNLFGKYKAK